MWQLVLLDNEKQGVTGCRTIFLSFTILVRVYAEGAVRGPSVTPTTHATHLKFLSNTFVENVFKVCFDHLDSFLSELLQVFDGAETRDLLLYDLSLLDISAHRAFNQVEYLAPTRLHLSLDLCQ